jgi:hypothetical protein
VLVLVLVLVELPVLLLVVVVVVVVVVVGGLCLWSTTLVRCCLPLEDRFQLREDMRALQQQQLTERSGLCVWCSGLARPTSD